MDKIKCPYCDFKAANIGGLKTHIKSEHPDKYDLIKSGEINLEQVIIDNEIEGNIKKGVETGITTADSFGKEREFGNSGIEDKFNISEAEIHDPVRVKPKLGKIADSEIIVMAIEDHSCEICKKRYEFKSGKMYRIKGIVRQTLSNARKRLFVKVKG